ncbi:MAG: sulfite exporter TauE/SafE family protein [Verrucomicrobiales bacterium]|nr:sulfite exporter TauE/SafE family protein [Verrucomicrobiales bacterium]
MPALDTTAAAFVAGLVTSVHCVGMCGPLSCAWAVRRGESFMLDAGLYHGGRLLSYSVLGALAGAVGVMPLQWLNHGAVLILPWALVVFFAAVGLGLDRFFPKPVLASGPMRWMRTRALKLPPASRAGLLGIATPLLPCGPLYIMLGLAMTRGSMAGGAEFAGAFALGTLPLLWLAQGQLHRLGMRLSPVALRRLQQVLALVTAVVLAWRLRGTLAGGEDGLIWCH